MGSHVASREIENAYALRAIAASSPGSTNFAAAFFRVQVEAALANLQALGEVADRQDRTNAELKELRQGIDEVNSGINELNRTASATLDAIEEQNDILEDGLREISEQLASQGKALSSILQTLQRPYTTKVRELYIEANKWLQAGMQRTGSERAGDFQDALSLLRKVTENPIGKQDHVVWFQIGWLLWKHEGNIPAAEAAFRRATRLGSLSRDLYHLLSVRHLAHMEYLQGKIEEAYQTISPAKSAAMDHDTPFDAARYAAITGRLEEAVGLLESCIQRQPFVVTTIFAEPDFRPLTTRLLELRHRKVEQARANANREIGDLVLCAERMRRVAEASRPALGPDRDFTSPSRAAWVAEASRSVLGPEVVEGLIGRLRAEMAVADYVNLLNIEKNALNAREKTYAAASKFLEVEAARRQMEIREIDGERGWRAKRQDEERSKLVSDMDRAVTNARPVFCYWNDADTVVGYISVMAIIPVIVFVTLLVFNSENAGRISGYVCCGLSALFLLGPFVISLISLVVSPFELAAVRRTYRQKFADLHTDFVLWSDAAERRRIEAAADLEHLASGLGLLEEKVG